MLKITFWHQSKDNETRTLGHNIQELLSDNGAEFDCEEVKRILSENGISHHTRPSRMAAVNSKITL
jgi:transposase InsO family protein